MSQENVEIVRRSVEAMVREDWDAAVTDFTSTMEGHDHDIPGADVYIGPDGFRKWISEWSESWDTWTLEDMEYRSVSKDKVLLLQRMKATGRTSGLEIDRLDGVVYTLAGGSIARIDYFNSPQQALEAVGLSEWAMSQENVERVRRALRGITPP